MVSITRVEVAPDLGSARVHVSVMDTPEVEREVLRALEHTEPFLHRTLLKRLHSLKRTVNNCYKVSLTTVLKFLRLETALHWVQSAQGCKQTKNCAKQTPLFTLI